MRSLPTDGDSGFVDVPEGGPADPMTPKDIDEELLLAYGGQGSGVTGALTVLLMSWPQAVALSRLVYQAQASDLPAQHAWLSQGAAPACDTPPMQEPPSRPHKRWAPAAAALAAPCGARAAAQEARTGTWSMHTGKSRAKG